MCINSQFMPFLFFEDNVLTHSGIRITNVARLLEPLSFDRSEVALIEGSKLELTGGFSFKFDNIAAGLQRYMQSYKRSDINLCIQSIRWVWWSILPAHFTNENTGGALVHVTVTISDSSSIGAFNAHINSFSAISSYMYVSSCDKVAFSETQDPGVSVIIFSNYDPAQSIIIMSY